MKNNSYIVDYKKNMKYNININVNKSSCLKKEEVFKMGKIIEFKNVRKTYNIGEKTFNALDGVDFEINRGEFVVILGPSGAGKSTILNLIGGMDKITSGEIIVGGKTISNYSDNELTDYRAKNIGFIFQFYNILPTLTVLENVDLVKDIVKTSNSSIEILKEVGLEEHLNKFPNQLSGGEQQRVSIARAIAKDPLLLLCDEPTGALDSKTGVEVLKLLKKQCDSNNGNNTVIIVTHNSLIAEVADRVIKVKNGKVESNEININPKEIEEVNW
jgi:putative ABC transport system ATP-binding protein